MKSVDNNKKSILKTKVAYGFCWAGLFAGLVSTIGGATWTLTEGFNSMHISEKQEQILSDVTASPKFIREKLSDTEISVELYEEDKISYKQLQDDLEYFQTREYVYNFLKDNKDFDAENAKLEELEEKYDEADVRAGIGVGVMVGSLALSGVSFVAGSKIEKQIKKIEEERENTL